MDELRKVAKEMLAWMQGFDTTIPLTPPKIKVKKWQYHFKDVRGVTWMSSAHYSEKEAMEFDLGSKVPGTEIEVEVTP